MSGSQRSRKARNVSASSADRSAAPAPRRRASEFVRVRMEGRSQARTKSDVRESSLSVSPRAFLMRLFIAVVPLLLLGVLFLGVPLSAQETGAAANAPLVSSVHFGTAGIALLLTLLLILFRAFLATAEIALVTIRKSRLKQLVEEGSRAAQTVEYLLSDPPRFVATIQTTIMLVSVLAITLVAVFAAPPCAILLRSANLPERSALPLALMLILLPLIVLSLVVGVIVPQSVAARSSENFTLLAARPVALLQKIFQPAVALVLWTANLIVRPMGSTASFMTPAANEEELKLLVEASEEQGVLEAGETEMIHSILDFADTAARKIMTPRIDLTGISADATLSELVRQVNQSGHSRLPVYSGDLDNIVGIVHAKDVLARFDTPRDALALRDVMRPPYFIPETKKIDELLTEFRRSKQHIAIVRDEYGTVAGLVTIEDILEQIVGDIQDEYDVDEPTIQVLDGATTIFDGRVGLDDVNERMALELPTEEADTIGGFVFGLLGHQAQVGERVTWGEVEFIVEGIAGRRIKRVRMIRHAAHDESPADFNARKPAETQNDTAFRVAS